MYRSTRVCKYSKSLHLLKWSRNENYVVGMLSRLARDEGFVCRKIYKIQSIKKSRTNVSFFFKLFFDDAVVAV